jgi:uncharacterized protein YjhX (UPF0386 family)
MKNEKLTGDEYDALEIIQRDARTDKRSAAINACVGRNAKRLSGLKLVQYAKNGGLSLTEKGQEVLFLRRCIVALRALERDPASALDADVAQFLSRKSHIAALEGGGYELTERGRESLADIGLQEPKR